jgi:hypothetical protein
MDINKFKLGDVNYHNGKKSTVTDICSSTGAIEWTIEDIPNFDRTFHTLKDLNNIMSILAVTGDTKNDVVVSEINTEIDGIFRKYRKHLRTNYPLEYNKFK